MKRDQDIIEQLHFRSERTVRINGEWFFLTREGRTMGPFMDKNSALEHLDTHLDNVALAKLRHSFESILS